MKDRAGSTAAEIFSDALELEDAKRRELLDRACGENEELRREVESLLEAHAAAEDFLESSARLETLPPPRSVEGAPYLGGERVGSYRLERVLGEGGMGQVFLARRSDEEFEQLVAVKMVKRGLDTDRILGRFRTERQVLANLAHPNIARLLDGGATDEDRPYLVMEYVEGTPIDRYCDQRRLGVEARLELFLQVCEAVQYAHRNLVVHRDLKPSNVLVTDEGQVKLLDFGIAKVLDQAADAGQGTVTMMRAMTPRYASPEQVAGSSVSTASDVYSLGVLLYELLTGRLPYPGTGSALELERSIRERDPDRPSVAVARPATVTLQSDDEPSTSAVEALAAARSLQPAALRRRLRGDLDTILLHCLRKEPERRYGSAAELGSDVRRHLDGEPISARPASPGYVLTKFVRRNRALVAAAGVVLLALVVGGVGLAVGLDRALDSAREEARQRRVAEAVNDFLNNDLLAAVDPENTSNPDVTMREVLDAATGRLATRYTDQPAVDAAIRTTLGVTYSSLGENGVAEALLEEALRLRRRELGEENGETIRTLRALADATLRSGRLEEAERLARRAHGQATESLGPEDLITVEAANSLGLVLAERGSFAEAESIYRSALASALRNHGEEHPTTLTLKSNLAQVLSYAGKLEESEQLYLELIEVQARVWGPLHPSSILHLNNLGFVYVGMERYEEAKARFEKAVEVARQVWKEDHPRLLATLSNLGLPDAYRGNFEVIEPLWLDVLRRRRAILAPDHPELLQSLNNMAFLYQSTGRLEEALPLAEEAAEGRRRTLGDRHPNTLNSLNNLGLLYERLGKEERARALWEETLRLRREVLGEAAEGTLVTRRNLARIYRELGDVDRSLALLDEGLEAARELGGVLELPLLRELGESLLEASRLEEAEAALLEVYERSAAQVETRQLGLESAALLADLHERLGRVEESLEWRRLASE